MRERLPLIALVLVSFFTNGYALDGVTGAIPTDSRFRTLVLDETFQSEGADVADIDGDGHQDVVSGPFWYRGPDFRQRYAYAKLKDYSIKAYSDHFFSFAHDFNGDGLQDILSIAIPGRPGVWYQNPGQAANATGIWTKHLAIESVDNESPTFQDLTGDGVPELICIHNGNFGFARWDVKDATQPWSFTTISNEQKLGRFTHGLGVGDVDSDGRNDVLETNGWWQQPDQLGEPFTFHEQRFAQRGGAQMFAYDFDGDGDNDVVSVQNAHAHGLCWFERRGSSEDDFLFVKHVITDEESGASPYGLSLSQMHAIALADIDGDGVKDIVTGKRFYAHGGKDPDAFRLPMLVWFRTVRKAGEGVHFVPHVIHLRSGVGTQVTIADIDGNDHADIIVGNKLGTFVSLNSGKAGRSLAKRSASTSPDTQPLSLIGTDAFKIHVRETQPLDPEVERLSFILPEGFEAQLVASEPDIGKPMNLAFDSAGRLWVSSSVEYPYAAPNDRKGRDTIKILEDTTGNGRADKITTFADGLNIPVGLYPYRDGVVCFSIPNVLFLRDTDGDGKADHREVLYGPMDTSRDTHGMCNGFTRGFDGWLYACHGFNNQTTVSGRDGHQVAMHSGNTFRMQMDGSRVEHFTHGQVNPFGMNFTPDGDLFTADCHTKPITMLMQGGYYQSFSKPHDGLGFVPDVMEHLHGSTGIGGIAFYHDHRYPRAFRETVFAGNVMTGRVNRNSIRHVGSSVRAREEADFLVSNDPWFRPVDLQIGPDGALYIADFYNRIIGHYEVDLDHPGRDRTRGRIWRVVYSGTENRRDAAPVATTSSRQATDQPISLQDAIDGLLSANLGTRMRSADVLADHYAGQAVEACQRVLAKGTASTCSDRESDAAIQAAWVLHRLQALSSRELRVMIDSPRSFVRGHGYQILAATRNTASRTPDFQATDADEKILRSEELEWVDRIIAGLGDDDALVRRHAVMATKRAINKRFVRPLLSLLRSTPPKDVHLCHAIRMSLRDHLTSPRIFSESTGDLMKNERLEILRLCPAIQTDFAGTFLIRYLSDLKDAPMEELAEYMKFGARFSSTEHLPALAQIAQVRFAGDRELQETLLRAVRAGLNQRGVQISTPIRDWATKLAADRFGIAWDDPASRPSVKASPIAWTYASLPTGNNVDNCWQTSQRRDSSDGQTNSVLHSSFPKGERRTGIYRSDVFELGEEFGFFMAGHDGYPQEPIQHKNWISVRNAATKAVLRKWSPPRNDTAQHTTWLTKEHAGKLVYVELVDGDNANAYAWLAVGRFSELGLNPSRLIEDWRAGAKLVADFELRSLRGLMLDLLRHKTLDATTSVEIARASLAGQTTGLSLTLAESLSVFGVSGPLRDEIVRQLSDEFEPAEATTALSNVMRVATSSEQKRLANALVSESSSIPILIKLIQQGRASASLLNVPAISEKLSATADADQMKLIDQLRRSVPMRDQQISKLIAKHRRDLESGAGDRIVGKQVFTKKCGVCHQVAGQGKQAGPNLDGVGNRGIGRLTEDVFLPSKNVDVAFRSTIVLLDDGTIHTGLMTRIVGAQQFLVEATGKEISFATDAIERHEKSLLSPMPGDFAETLTQQETRHLFAYLLSLTQ